MKEPYLKEKRRPLVYPLLFLILTQILAAASSFALTEEEQNTIAIYEKVAKSIVNITTQACEPEFFFCAVPTSGSGSGIILKEDGTIVTNYHVVTNAQNIEVGLEDGHRFKARVVGISRQDDIAVIKVDPEGHPFKAITLGDPGSLKIGEKVLAIGNPFGLGQTLTVGTVSMIGRDIKDNGRVIRDLIQTDASINPGNSGGALVNSKGDLVGMNTMILSPTGSNVGIGFAIPASRIEKAVPGILNPWKKRVGWLLGLLVLLWILKRIYQAGAMRVEK